MEWTLKPRSSSASTIGPCSRLDSDMDLARLTSARLQERSHHASEANTVMREELRCQILRTTIIARETRHALDASTNTHNHLVAPCMMNKPLIRAPYTAPSDRARRLASHRDPQTVLFWRFSSASTHWASMTAASPGRISSKGARQQINTTEGTRLAPADGLGSGKLRD